MHLYRVVDLPGRDDEALANVMRHMLRLGWDIEASAPLWARAKTGSWWEKKVEVEVVAGGGTLAIDAEPVSSLGVGPAWRAKVQEAVDELASALGVAPEPATARPQPSKPFSFPEGKTRVQPGVEPDARQVEGRQHHVGA